MSHEIYAGFAKRLIQLCEEKKLPERGRQAALARLCEIKPSSVNKWFNAVSLPDASNLLAIADWGRTSVDWLLTGRVSKESTSQDALTWVKSDEQKLLSEYRQCTDAGKRLLLDLAEKAEKGKEQARAAS
ncbi:MAG: helix-turn-helix domain-containing protein [Burkholderiaceae bacterium]|nr:helix-turn-helix domain-containing protein [Burkholderiaceae bacterium]